MKKNLHITIAGMAVFLSILACQAFPTLPQAINTPITPTSTPIPLPTPVAIEQLDLVSLQESLIDLYERVSPGVVSIQVLTEEGGGLGSGFVLDTDGNILTNYHVVAGTQDLEVDFPSGLKVRGKVLGTDLDSDIAVVKVDVDPAVLVPLPLGDSEVIKVGQTVVAIGNPFGLSGTMTVGIVSGVGRTLDSMREAGGGNYFGAGGIIQTDTAINPGNSGGPLLNLNGEVIGINRAIRTDTFTTAGEPLNSGIGFAISINIVKRVVPSLIAEGKYDYPYLGITSTNELTLIEQEALGLSRATGVYVVDVTPGSPADDAGLHSGTAETEIGGLFAGGDLIIAIDGTEVRTFADLLGYLFSFKSPGDTVVLTVLRGEEETQIKLTLGKRP
jgi:2-alkenal reductase